MKTFDEFVIQDTSKLTKFSLSTAQKLYTCLRVNFGVCTVKLGIKELLNKEQIGFKELFTDYQLFYTINLLLIRNFCQSKKCQTWLQGTLDLEN